MVLWSLPERSGEETFFPALLHEMICLVNVKLLISPFPGVDQHSHNFLPSALCYRVPQWPVFQPCTPIVFQVEITEGLGGEINRLNKLGVWFQAPSLIAQLFFQSKGQKENLTTAVTPGQQVGETKHPLSQFKRD